MVQRLAAACALLFMSLCAGASVAQDAKSAALARSAPIADMHMHLGHGKSPAFYEERMDRNNVRWGGGVGGSLRDDPLAVKRHLGSRYVAALGQGEFFAIFFARGEAGLMDADEPRFRRLFEEAEAAFSSGQARGFGEIHINNNSRYSDARIRRRIPLESPVVLRMFEIANRHGGFVQIHTSVSSGLDELTNVARRFGRTKIILSHCLPGASPQQVRFLLASSPNIHCEVSAQGPVHGIERIFSREGVRPEWRALIAAMPTRFMLGTDPCCGLEGSYDEMIRELREHFLPAFDAKTIRLLAHGNAQRLFGLR